MTGSWRVTNKIDGHDVTYMRGDGIIKNQGDPRMTTIVVGILFGVALIIAGVLVFVAMRFNKRISQLKDQQTNAIDGGNEMSNYSTAKRVDAAA